MTTTASQSRVGESERELRVAMLWGGSLQAEELLSAPRPVTLAADGGGMFPLPDGLVPGDSITLLSPNGLGYAYQPHAELDGFVSLGGVRRDVRELAAATRLGPDDYGVVTLGNIAVFFQHVRPVSRAAVSRLSIDPALVACFGLSAFVHIGLLLFLFLVAAKELAPVDPLELDAELVKKFLVVPPPEEELKKLRKAGTETEDPGLRDRDEAGGKKHKDSEGRVGRKDATREDTQLAGEPKDVVAAKVRSLGLLGVLAGGGPQNALSNALDAPSLDKMLGGLGAVQTVTGRGSGGLGLRGAGAGGGGTGQGTLFGAGELGTGVGAGSGSGKGRGAGGIGVSGAKAKEAQLSLDNSGARVSGFLSKEQIDRVVRANQAAIKYCFEVEMQRQPSLQGAVHMSWRIDREGRVASVRVAKSTLGNARVEGCMARQIKRWAFPRPDGGEVDVTYPFLLRGN
jgi:hypothetical protein